MPRKRRLILHALPLPLLVKVNSLYPIFLAVSEQLTKIRSTQHAHTSTSTDLYLRNHRSSTANLTPAKGLTICAAMAVLLVQPTAEHRPPTAAKRQG
jgi:hypothetical protein